MAFGIYDEQRNFIIPHPEVRLPVLLIVESAICAAWDLLRNSPRAGFDLLTAKEDEVTLELHEALCDRVFKMGIVEGFDAKIFSLPEREPKIRNYDRTRPDKMPDLMVRLLGRPAGIKNTQDGLFIECKPLDSKHPVRMHYLDKGLARFIRGDYAWAMTVAMMLGYAKEGYAIAAKLIPALTNWPEGTALTVTARPCAHSKAGAASEAVHTTEHTRGFRYLETRRGAPPITIRHLWLRRD
jgi:hypothetical protein